MSPLLENNRMKNTSNFKLGLLLIGLLFYSSINYSSQHVFNAQAKNVICIIYSKWRWWGHYEGMVRPKSFTIQVDAKKENITDSFKFSFDKWNAEQGKEGGTAGSITQAPVISLNLADMLEGPDRGCTGRPSNKPSLFVTHTPRCLFPIGCDAFFRRTVAHWCGWWL